MSGQHEENFANNYNMADHTIGNYWWVPEPSMRFIYHEHALSEVIGFILILVVVITAFSIYLVYAVPMQGREQEILHMNEIRDQFVAYKIGIDALWTNNQINSAMSTTFNLGTPGAATQGSFSFLPIMNPVASSGTLSLNQRGETLTIQSRGLLGDGTVRSNQTVATGSLPLNATPTVFWVNISDTIPTTCVYTQANSQKRSVLVQEGQNWSVNVTVNPKLSNYYYCNSTDITIDVTKTGIKTLQGYTVYQNIQTLTNYTINLLDDAYGLNNYLAARPYPMTVTFTKYPPTGGTINGYGIVSFTDEYDHIVTDPALTLGALQYDVRNNYWIPQTYYYQNGGVFLVQDTGTSIKLPPAITFSYNTTTRVIGVKIIELPFQTTNAGSLGGNSPAQVRTQVTNIQNLPYSQTYNNTKWINLSIASSDSRAVAAWISALDTSANISAGIPTNYYFASATGSTRYFLINGTDQTQTLYDIHVEGLRANLSATMQGG
jgi:hypothetical protein